MNNEMVLTKPKLNENSKGKKQKATPGLQCLQAGNGNSDAGFA